jgi:hypothetical protein
MASVYHVIWSLRDTLAYVIIPYADFTDARHREPYLCAGCRDTVRSPRGGRRLERAGAPISDPLVPIESWLLYCGLHSAWCPRARCFGALVPDGMLHQNKTFCGSEWDRPHRAFSPVITKNFASIRTAFRIPLHPQWNARSFVHPHTFRLPIFWFETLPSNPSRRSVVER